MDGSVVIGIELRDQTFTEALSRLRRTAEQTAVQGFQNLVNSINAVSTAFSRTAISGISWGQQITNMFSRVTAGAAVLGPTLLSAGRSAGAQFMAGIRSVDGQGAGRFLAQSALNGFTYSGFQEAGARAAALLAGGLSSGAGTITARAKAAASAVGAAFYGGWYSVGYNVASGIASGIYGGSSAIRSAAVSAAQNALYWAKRALGIRSPSRVFREEVGRMIPEGIAEGISAGQKAPQAAIRRQADALVQTARRDVTPALTRHVSGSGGIVPAAGDREMKISLEAPLYVDGRELARATAKYTGQQIIWEAM